MEDFHSESSADNRLIRYDKLAPLEFLAQAQCAINLIDYDEVRKFCTGGINLPNEKNALRGYLFRKISKLRLPRSMNEMLIRNAYHVINEIDRWIKYHDREIFNIGEEIYSIALWHLEAITWTCLGTIDYLASAKKLTKRSLDVDTKLRISCAYRLYDNVDLSVYLKKLFPRRKWDPLLERPSLYYWMRHVYSDDSEIESIYGYGERSNTSVEMFLFNVLAATPNYILIRCVWNELTKAEKIQRILDLVNADVSSDLLLHLLSQFKAEDQISIIHSRVPQIFRILANDIYKRSFYDNLIDYIWRIMTYYDFTEIIKQLLKSVNNPKDETRQKCKQIFREFWSSVSISLRYQALEYDYGPSLHLQHNRRYQRWRRRSSMLLPSDWMNNEDLVELVLRDASIVQRKHYLKTNSSVTYAIQMIKKGKWTMLESFIKRFLIDRDDILEYKATVIQGNDYELIKHFYEANHRLAENFYTWIFESQPRMNQFIEENRSNMWNKMSDFFVSKKNIYKVESFLEWCLLSPSKQTEWLQKFKIDTWHKLIKQCSKTSLNEVEYFLDWSFKTSNDIFKLQFVLPANISLLTKYICILIKENESELLNLLPNWCFLFDQQKIREFKLNFLENCEIQDFLDVIKSTVVLRDNFVFFYNVFGWWFDNEEDFRVFRLKISAPGIVSWIAAEFVSINKPDMADEFFKWCFEFNDDQMVKLKIRIHLDESVNNIIIKYESERFISNFEKWLNLPIER